MACGVACDRVDIMSSGEGLIELEAQLRVARDAAEELFRAWAMAIEADSGRVWAIGEVPKDLLSQSKKASTEFHRALVRTAALVRKSPMFGNADQQVIQLVVRRIDAALRMRNYREWDSEVLHDEGTVLGVRPGGSEEDPLVYPSDALAIIDKAIVQVDRRLSILTAEAEAANAESVTLAAVGSLPVRPGTAFIMMMMDPEQPELEDVKVAIQEEFARVGVRAIRADDIEHGEEITHRILDQIRNAEFLIADVSGERPSVYYEIGYAHAIGKRVILYRKKGSTLHFDLAVHNCPEYANLTELREKLRKRLAAMTNQED
jgi:hypothetical protein